MSVASVAANWPVVVGSVEAFGNSDGVGVTAELGGGRVTFGIATDASLRRRDGSSDARGSGGGGMLRCAAGPGEIALSSERRAPSSGSETAGTATLGGVGTAAGGGSGGGTGAAAFDCDARIADASDRGITWDASARRGGSVAPARGGSWTPVGGALRCRRGGSGGNRRPHARHDASSSAFSALQNGQNRISRASGFGLRASARAGQDLSLTVARSP
jgi:hypothetical protein